MSKSIFIRRSQLTTEKWNLLLKILEIKEHDVWIETIHFDVDNIKVFSSIGTELFPVS